MKKLIVLFASVVISAGAANAQKIAIKNNFPADFTSSLNIGAEFSVAKHFTADLYYSVNPFTFKDNKKFQHHLIMPEFRYWLCESFNGLFFGAHGFWAMYNVGGVRVPMAPNLRDFRFEGQLYGGGATVGYQWILGKRWNLEASIGAGYILIDYDKYECPSCGDYLNSGKVKMFGLTRASVAIVFFFN